MPLDCHSAPQGLRILKFDLALQVLRQNLTNSTITNVQEASLWPLSSRSHRHI